MTGKLLRGEAVLLIGAASIFTVSTLPIEECHSKLSASHLYALPVDIGTCA